jgi:hypothetical protein
VPESPPLRHIKPSESSKYNNILRDDGYPFRVAFFVPVAVLVAVGSSSGCSAGIGPEISSVDQRTSIDALRRLNSDALPSPDLTKEKVTPLYRLNRLLNGDYNAGIPMEDFQPDA